MSQYVDISISYNLFSSIIDYIEYYVECSNNFDEIHDGVQAIDYLCDEYDAACARYNKEMTEFMKYKEMRKNNEKPHDDIFNKISKVLKSYNIQTDIPDQEFYLTCELADLFYKQGDSNED